MTSGARGWSGPRVKNPIPSGPFRHWIESRIGRYEVEYEPPAAPPPNVPWRRRDPVPRRRKNHRPEGYLPLRPTQLVTQEIGWGIGESAERKLRRIRAGTTAGDIPTDLIERKLVEDALDHAGVPIDEVYPELAIAVPLEPDEFCERCGDWSTPIDGVCPWCESTLAMAA